MYGLWMKYFGGSLQPWTILVVAAALAPALVGCDNTTTSVRDNRSIEFAIPVSKADCGARSTGRARPLELADVESLSICTPVDRRVLATPATTFALEVKDARFRQVAEFLFPNPASPRATSLETLKDCDAIYYPPVQVFATTAIGAFRIGIPLAGCPGRERLELRQLWGLRDFTPTPTST